jgi:hypothetical protein
VGDKLIRKLHADREAIHDTFGMDAPNKPRAVIEHDKIVAGRTPEEQKRHDETNLRDDIFAGVKVVTGAVGLVGGLAGIEVDEVEEDFLEQVENGRTEMLAAQQLGKEAGQRIEENAQAIGDIVGRDQRQIVALLKEPAINSALQAVIFVEEMREANGGVEVADLPEAAKTIGI